MSKSTIYLIPSPLSDNAMHTIPGYVQEIIHGLTYFIVERAKTSRAFIKATNHPMPLQEINVEEIDKHDETYIFKVFNEWLKAGHNIGILSEAGAPGIADPGAKLISRAHETGAKVVPLVGPSSILMAMMASGMNGQQFSFHGYLPQNEDKLRSSFKQILQAIKKDQSAHIFIETPYRNKKLFNEILKYLPSDIKLNLSIDLTGKKEYSKTDIIANWKKKKFPIDEKIPCIFILGR